MTNTPDSPLAAGADHTIAFRSGVEQSVAATKTYVASVVAGLALLGNWLQDKALLAALDSGKVAGVWFDAFWEEPYTGPLTRYEQAILTPHVGTYTERCRLQMETEAVRNLLRDLGLPEFVS